MMQSIFLLRAAANSSGSCSNTTATFRVARQQRDFSFTSSFILSNNDNNDDHTNKAGANVIPPNNARTSLFTATAPRSVISADMDSVCSPSKNLDASLRPTTGMISLAMESSSTVYNAFDSGDRAETEAGAAETITWNDPEKRPHCDETAYPDILRQRTGALAHEKVPFGEFTAAMWHEAIHLLRRWVYTSPLVRTPESVDQSFIILDRLILEQEAQRRHPLSLKLLNTRLLRTMVYNWYHCVKCFHNYSLEDQAMLRYEYTPMELLARLEDYSDRSPRLQFDTRCLNMIIAGAQLCSIVGNTGEAGMISPRVAIPFAESLFDRMLGSNKNDNMPCSSSEQSLQSCIANAAPADDKLVGCDQDVHHEHNISGNLKQNIVEEYGFPYYSDPSADGDHHRGENPPPLGQHETKRHDHKLPSTRPDLRTYSSLIKMFASNGLAFRAEALLNRLYQDYKVTSDEDLKPDANAFTSVMKAWSKSDDPNAAYRADAILRRMHELTECGIESVAPDRVAYAVVLSCWAKVAGKARKEETLQACVDQARELFAEMESLGYTDTLAYNVMMDVYGKTRNPQLAEELLSRMHRECAKDNDTVQPTSYTYNTLLAAWTKSGSPECGDRAEEILRDFEELYQAGRIQDAPNRVTYNSVLACLAKAKKAERAERLLQIMKKEETMHGENIKPDRVSYNIVINAHAEAKNPRRAEALLENMYQEHSALGGEHSHLEPSVTTFSTVLKAWLKSGEAHAAVRADAIFRTMQNLHDARILNVAPNAIAYNIMLSCWCQSKHPQAPFQALAMLKRMEVLFNGGNSFVRPDEHSYDSVIKALANRFLIQQADETLERMHIHSLPTAMGGMGNIRAKPLARSYKRVLGACSRWNDPDAAERAVSLWNRWQERFEKGLVEEAPAEVAMHLVLNTFLNAARHNSNAGRLAKAFLDNAIEKYDTGDTNLMPRLKAHITLIEIFAKLDDAASAHDHFMRICNCSLEDNHSNLIPSIELLNLVLGAWRSSGSPNAALSAEALLQKAQELAQAGVINWKPNLASYRAYLNCLEEHPSWLGGIKASATLEEMAKLPVLDETTEKFNLGARDYVQVVRIWSKIADPEAVLVADAVFQRMLNLYNAGEDAYLPSSSAFHLIINAWTRSKNSASVDRINQLQEQLSMTHATPESPK